jgi:hypothetical protein
MANTVFEATYQASQQITETFDMVWPIVGGLWNLKTESERYFIEHPGADGKQAKKDIVPNLDIHGFNARRFSKEISWEKQNQYVAKILLINSMAIFDAWVDAFVDSSLRNLSKNKKKEICDNVKKGDFSSLENAISSQPISPLQGCFHFTAKRQDAYIDKLRLIYKYFKTCRNSCAHGGIFSSSAETNYNAIAGFNKDECGLKEFPIIFHTIAGQPVKLSLRGVVGFYDVMIRIINHYDLVAADYYCVENELVKRCAHLKSVQLSSNIQKRNRSIRHFFPSVNMCPPYSSKTTAVYNAFLACTGSTP